MVALICVVGVGVGCGGATRRSTNDDVRFRVRKHHQPIEACYEQHRAMSGPVTVYTHFALDEAGAVRLAEVMPGTALPERARPLAACVLTVIQRIVFQPRPGKGFLDVNYPFTFKEGSPAR